MNRFCDLEPQLLLGAKPAPAKGLAPQIFPAVLPERIEQETKDAPNLQRLPR
jgi:hypothetical protein